MTFHPDVKDWMLDIFHALACYLIAGPGKAKASTSPAANNLIYWIFPSYVDMVKGGAASKASRIIAKCRENDVEGVVEGVNSHGIRVTATDDMTFHHLLSVFATIARGGWDFKSDNLAFYYFTKKLHIVSAGKVLAGWPDPRQRVHAPTLDAFVTVENKAKVDLFCNRLFAQTEVPLLGDELKGFRDAMVASLLMYYEDVKRDLGDGSLIITKMHQAALFAQISDSPLMTMLEWAKAVRTRFLAANAKNLGDVDMTETDRLKAAVELLQNMHVENSDIIKELRARLESMSGSIEEIKTMLLQLTITGSSPTSSPRVTNKRSRTDSSSSSPLNSTTDIAEQTEATLPSATDALMHGAAVAAGVKVSFNPKGLNTCGILVSNCILTRQDVDAKYITTKKLWLGNDVNKNQRAKLKRVYCALRNRAEPAQKQYFMASQFPVRVEELYQWSEEVTRFVPTLVDTFINEMIRRCHPGLGPAEFEKKKKKKGVAPFAVEALMREYQDNHTDVGFEGWVSKEQIGIFCN